ncbi:hypothetical protein LTR84_006839 [Exophiala bonariae]|uniref:Monopolin complex subunit Csm1/Pcs1 C-terminal domain-containing protein n=1 Tax=Exophiala bonariae TaxID=1690606 RepID=A0AAV9N0D5_9EURO|nr:hypothetical protein LTR84_006839 [Exophiala bonariae]
MKGLADLIDSDMEDSTNFIDENSILSSASDASAASSENGNPSKRNKKRRSVNLPPKSRSKVQKTSTTTAKQPTAKQAAARRKALEEQINDHDDELEDNEAVPEFAPPKPKKAAGAPAKPRATKKAAAQKKIEKEEDMEIEQTPAVARSNHAGVQTQPAIVKVAPKQTASKSKAKQETHAIVPESQGTAQIMEEEQSELAVVEPVVKVKNPARATSRSRQEPPFRRRAGSASDTERGDPNLRRKLGDITRKFENVDLKYRTLKEVGVNEANANMEKLRKQCDATVKASNELIASLKKELAAQAPQAQEARKLKTQMQSQENEVNRLRETATELAKSLSDAQNEIKALQAKVAAARAASTEQAVVKQPPVSAKKAMIQRPTATGSAEAAHAAQVAQMKEDLYSDLTGLIIRGVKKTEEGDTYDCIQTGRNGTLHFKLYVDQEDARTTSFEETEFLYTPLLDAKRDHEMMELMPSYLTEDITFARQNAAKFYGRVVDTLTKRRAED